MEDAAGGSHVRDDDAGAVALREWLVSQQVTFGRDGVDRRVLEGDLKVIYYLLEDVVECWQTPVAGTSCTRQR
jgi:hypothetical protein